MASLLLPSAPTWAHAISNIDGDLIENIEIIKGKDEYKDENPSTLEEKEKYETSEGNVVSKGNLVKPHKNTAWKVKKSVQFSRKLQVVLIPCRNDYISCKLHDVLWWNHNDIIGFKESLKKEIVNLSNKQERSMSLENAAKLVCSSEYVSDQDSQM